MDWRTFIASLVGSLAWPGAVAIIILAYREAITDRIRAIKRFKYQDVEVSLGPEIEQVAAQVDAAVPEGRSQAALHPVHEVPATSEWRGQVDAVARVAPSAAYVLAWSHLEQELVNAARMAGIPVSGSGSPRALIHGLMNIGWLDAEKADVLSHLRNIRNKAAHQPMNVSEAEVDAAAEYADLVERMIRYLKRIQARQPEAKVQ